MQHPTTKAHANSKTMLNPQSGLDGPSITKQLTFSLEPGSTPFSTGHGLTADNTTRYQGGGQ
ncbi:hypothetical protein M404DRAFT_993376, partial [Pisolithus tinctorius Marx 270]